MRCGLRADGRSWLWLWCGPSTLRSSRYMYITPSWHDRGVLQAPGREYTVRGTEEGLLPMLVVDLECLEEAAGAGGDSDAMGPRSSDSSSDGASLEVSAAYAVCDMYGRGDRGSGSGSGGEFKFEFDVSLSGNERNIGRSNQTRRAQGSAGGGLHLQRGRCRSPRSKRYLCLVTAAWVTGVIRKIMSQARGRFGSKSWPRVIDVPGFPLQDGVQSSRPTRTHTGERVCGERRRPPRHFCNEDNRPISRGPAAWA